VHALLDLEAAFIAVIARKSHLWDSMVVIALAIVYLLFSRLCTLLSHCSFLILYRKQSRHPDDNNGF